MNKLTVLTLRYKDGFGRLKSFVCCGHYNQKDQGQSLDVEVKRQMKRLGIKQCRVRYTDWSWIQVSLIKGSIYKKPVPYRIQPQRKDRTIRL